MRWVGVFIIALISMSIAVCVTTDTTSGKPENPHCVVKRNFDQRLMTHCDDGSATVTTDDKFIFCAKGKDGVPSCQELILSGNNK
ncbi:UNVERIFIED_ORG: hypothetical protein FHU00_3963 [Citrobacter freundii]